MRLVALHKSAASTPVRLVPGLSGLAIGLTPANAGSGPTVPVPVFPARQLRIVASGLLEAEPRRTPRRR